MHTIEMPFIYGDWTYYGLGPLIFRPDNQEGWEALSESMVKYLGYFCSYRSSFRSNRRAMETLVQQRGRAKAHSFGCGCDPNSHPNEVTSKNAAIGNYLFIWQTGGQAGRIHWAF